MRSLRVQLLIGHLLLVLLVAIVMVDATGDLLNISNSFDIVLTKRIALVDSTQRMRESLGKQRAALALVGAGKEQEGRLLYQEGENSFDQDLTDAEKKTLSESDVFSIQRIKQLHKLLDSSSVELLKGEPTDPTWRESYLEGTQVYMQLTDTIHDLALRNQKSIFTASAKAQQFARRAYVKSIVVTFIAIFVALLLSNRILAIVLRPLREVISAVELLGTESETVPHPKISLKTSLQEFRNLKSSVNQLEARLDSLRKMEAERLQHARLLAEEAIRSLSEPVVTCDITEQIVLMNPVAQATFGSSAESMFVKDLPRELAEALRASLDNSQPSEAKSKPRFLKVKNDAEDKFFRIHTNPIKNEEQVLGAVAVMEDVTSWHELDEMKNRFIEVVSHELRTPVTSLLLSSDLLLEGAAGALSEKQVQLATTQHDDLQRLEKLIKDLLETAKTGYKDRKPRFAEVNLPALVAQARHGVEALATEQAVDIQAVTDDGKFQGDEGQLLQVLTNLLENAIRHSERGQTVQIHASLVNNEVLFSVEDHGKGIPEKYLNNIFDRFVQVPGATAGGAGLGLSIARSIVEAHGGQISVQSQPGHGSIFSFRIPINPAKG